MLRQLLSLLSGQGDCHPGDRVFGGFSRFALDVRDSFMSIVDQSQRRNAELTLGCIVGHPSTVGIHASQGLSQTALEECCVIQGTTRGVRSKRPRSNDSVYVSPRRRVLALRVWLAGRSAQDVIARQSNDSGAIESPHVPHAPCDATAPDNSKTIPAYAHSLSLRNPGTTMVIAPGILRCL